MKQEKLKLIQAFMDIESPKIVKEMYWKAMKDYYLTLKTDDEKTAFLAKLFQDLDKKKEG